jgi:hypothetical protein
MSDQASVLDIEQDNRRTVTKKRLLLQELLLMVQQGTELRREQLSLCATIIHRSAHVRKPVLRVQPMFCFHSFCNISPHLSHENQLCKLSHKYPWKNYTYQVMVLAHCL